MHIDHDSLKTTYSRGGYIKAFTPDDILDGQAIQFVLYVYK